MRRRVVAIIIKDKNILLAREGWADWFSTPGGTIEESEEAHEALEREMKEELAIKLTKSKIYYTHEYIHTRLNVPQREKNYMVTFEGIPKPSAEIEEIKWASKEDIQSGKIKVLENFKGQLFPQLLKDNLL